jgi:hypothetical protein
MGIPTLLPSTVGVTSFALFFSKTFSRFGLVPKRSPNPEEIEKLGCIVWKLRTEVTGEPLERYYLQAVRIWAIELRPLGPFPDSCCEQGLSLAISV